MYVKSASEVDETQNNCYLLCWIDRKCEAARGGSSLFAKVWLNSAAGASWTRSLFARAEKHGIRRKTILLPARMTTQAVVVVRKFSALEQVVV